MNIALVQYDIAWESPFTNRKKIESLLKATDSKFDLLILPEMFTTGFSMNTTAIAEKMNGETIQWMQKVASNYNAVVAGSLIIEEEGKYFNRLIWMPPGGNLGYYDKKHLFTLAKEDRYFTSGVKKCLFEIKLPEEHWKICPLICYDLRFPVWSRNTEDYDLLIYVANFPEKRAYAWSQLLIARAIENQSFVIGVNRIGVDGVNIPYSGNSVILAYDGHPLLEANNKEGVFTTEIKQEKQRQFRRAYNFLRDRDAFEVLG